jgi:hypothetical protein
MIGDGHCLHVEFSDSADEVGNPDGPVEHGILGMDVEVNKGSGHKINTKEKDG